MQDKCKITLLGMITYWSLLMKPVNSFTGRKRMWIWDYSICLCIFKVELCRRKLLMLAISRPNFCPWHGTNKLCDKEISLCWTTPCQLPHDQGHGLWGSCPELPCAARWVVLAAGNATFHPAWLKNPELGQVLRGTWMNSVILFPYINPALTFPKLVSMIFSI